MVSNYFQGLAIATLSIFALASCNKELAKEKVINVTLHGYNIGNTQLEVSVDTVVYDQKLQRPDAQVGFSMVYPYAAGKTEVTMRVKETGSGKELMQKKLDISGDQLEFYYNLVNINGSLLDINPPAADTATNKLGFYIYYPQSTDPIDILLYNPNTGYQKYIAQHVVPQTWVYTNYVVEEGFMEKNDVGSCTVYFLKAGTFDWAFNNDEYQSQTYGFGWYFPYTQFNLNKVQSYFILPSPNGWQVEVANLFPIPKVY